MKLRKYYVTYTYGEEDIATVWVMAFDKEHAKEKVRNEYWDCKSIIQVVEK